MADRPLQRRLQVARAYLQGVCVHVLYLCACCHNTVVCHVCACVLCACCHTTVACHVCACVLCVCKHVKEREREECMDALKRVYA